MLTRLSACCLVCFVLTPLHAAEKAPDLGFDYQAVFKEHMQLIADGKGVEAIKVLETNAQNADLVNAAAKEVLKKKFAAIYGTGGKLVNHEVVGYKRFTSRIYRFTVVSHYENLITVYTFTLVKTAAGDWKIANYGLTDSLEELEKMTPFVPISRPQD